jgi:nicotinic acid mononucleotide adenylyltransferase
MKKFTVIAGSSAYPPTNGHVALINGLRNSGIAERIFWFVSGARTEDKATLSEPIHREAMAHLSIPQEWSVEGCLVNIVSLPAYRDEDVRTWQLFQLMEQWLPNDNLVFATGSDWVALGQDRRPKIEHWHLWETELIHRQFLIIPREGYPQPGQVTLPHNCRWLNIYPPEVSSTMVRELIAAGADWWEEYVPPLVGQYIKANYLFGYHR